MERRQRKAIYIYYLFVYVHRCFHRRMQPVVAIPMRPLSDDRFLIQRSAILKTTGSFPLKSKENSIDAPQLYAASVTTFSGRMKIGRWQLKRTAPFTNPTSNSNGFLRSAKHYRQEVLYSKTSQRWWRYVIELDIMGDSFDGKVLVLESVCAWDRHAMADARLRRCGPCCPLGRSEAQTIHLSFFLLSSIWPSLWMPM